MFQLKEMEKKLSEYRKGSVPSSPATSGKFDGTYCVTDAVDSSLCSDDGVIHRPKTSHGRHSSSVAHRLSRSFREKNLLKYYRFIDSGKSPVKGASDARNLSVIVDSSFDDSHSMAHESQLDESRLADTSVDTLATSSSEESYKISNDSLYPASFKHPATHSSQGSELDLSFLTPPPAPKRREKKTPMSPNTRRSKRASWHYTMFQKLSPQVPRANKETAVWTRIQGQSLSKWLPPLVMEVILEPHSKSEEWGLRDFILSLWSEMNLNPVKWTSHKSAIHIWCYVT